MGSFSSILTKLDSSGGSEWEADEDAMLNFELGAQYIAESYASGGKIVSVVIVDYGRQSVKSSRRQG